MRLVLQRLLKGKELNLWLRSSISKISLLLFNVVDCPQLSRHKVPSLSISTDYFPVIIIMASLVIHGYRHMVQTRLLVPTLETGTLNLCVPGSSHVSSKGWKEDPSAVLMHDCPTKSRIICFGSLSVELLRFPSTLSLKRTRIPLLCFWCKWILLIILLFRLSL